MNGLSGIMDYLSAAKFVIILLCIHGINGQTSVVSGPNDAAMGTNVSLTCTVTGSVNIIQWIDDSSDPTQTIYTGPTRFSDNTKYLNFKITSLTSSESVMTIENAEAEDDGEYRCDIPTDNDGTINVVVEAPSTLTITLESFVESDIDMYRATCDAVGSKPQETITWTLNGISQTDGNGNTILETNPTATPPLSNTRSVFTFPATEGNLGQALVCRTSGHTLTDLDGEESRNLDIHSSPSSAGTNVTVDYVTQGESIVVSCTAVKEPVPTMRNYYIYANDSLIFVSSEGRNQETVQDPDPGTKFNCLAGNYLGNTSLSGAVTYDPTRTTVPPPTTAVQTTATTPMAGDNNDADRLSGDTGLSAGEIAGIAIGAILAIVIIVIVIVFFLKKGSGGSPGGGVSAKKHTSSTVGTSNGSEKEKIKPVAAPRDQGSIQHTTDNPGQAEYAMVDRKKSGGGDMPDTRGPSHDSPGMHYADLDLSTNAGHTERQVPQNPDNVVVYSSILV